MKKNSKNRWKKNSKNRWKITYGRGNFLENLILKGAKLSNKSNAAAGRLSKAQRSSKSLADVNDEHNSRVINRHKGSFIFACIDSML